MGGRGGRGRARHRRAVVGASEADISLLSSPNNAVNAGTGSQGPKTGRQGKSQKQALFEPLLAEIPLIMLSAARANARPPQARWIKRSCAKTRNPGTSFPACWCGRTLAASLNQQVR